VKSKSIDIFHLEKMVCPGSSSERPWWIDGVLAHEDPDVAWMTPPAPHNPKTASMMPPHPCSSAAPNTAANK